MKEVIVATALLLSFFYLSTSINEEVHLSSTEVDPFYLDKFVTWMRKHHKIYPSKTETMHRYSIFKDNYLYIQSHNAKIHLHGVELAANQFMDLSYEEFKLLMMKGRKRASNYYLAQDVSKIKYLNLTDLPESVDWRGKAISGIKNQGSCGGCWAFSAAGSLEGAYGAHHKTVISFSEQQIIDCCRINLWGCNGGDPSVAFSECLLRDGIMKTVDYPYLSIQQKNKCDYDEEKVVFTPSDYAIVPHNDSIQLKMALSLQPISVCVSDTPIFHFYKKGVVLDDKNCGLDNDHCVVAVGYGTKDGKDYWILKNSWGESWGDNGYLLVKRDNSSGDPGMCGVAMDASYVIV